MKCLCSLLIFLILFPFLPCALGVLPMRDQWRAACDALSTRQAHRAQELFREFDGWYSKEPAAREPGFRSRYIRLWGLAAMQAGDAAEALPLFEEWLTRQAPEVRFHAFVRFQAASACRLLGRDAEAVRHWDRFLEEHPDIPEGILVRWLKAEYLASEDRLDAAAAEFRLIAADPLLPPAGTALAAAALALIELNRGDPEQALLFLDGDASGSPARDLWQAVLAPALAAALLADDPGMALRATEWFDRPGEVSARAGNVLLLQQSASSVRQVLWGRHWEAQLQRLRSAAGAGSTTAPAQLHALRLRALINSGDPGRALLLGSVLMDSPSDEARSIRAEACAVSIEAAMELEEWVRASAIGDTFLAEFPAHPELPRILFMLARLAAARGDFSEGIRQAGRLVDQYPDDPHALSWKVSSAGWLLEGGRPAEAMDAFIALKGEAPPSWNPFLQFQQARCLDKLGRREAALEQLRRVMESGQAAASLKEQAMVQSLGIAMRGFEAPVFDTLVARYEERFPDGMSRFVVGNMAGSFHRLRGDLSGALGHFGRVAAATGEPAGFAREQISAILLQLKDWTALRQHVLGWVSNALESGQPLPPTPFTHLRSVASGTGMPALPPSLVPALMERLAVDEAAFPVGAFLDLLARDWDVLGETVGAGALPFPEWLEGKAASCAASGLHLGKARLRLHEATLLERTGRRDSADSIRIALLQSTDPARLDGDCLSGIAFIADDYDFPKAAEMLEALLGRFPTATSRPEALLRLARRRHSAGEADHAQALLTEIRVRWADARVFEEAALLSAAWHLEDQQPGAALAALEPLLERSSLDAPVAARALLLRAQADFMGGNPDRGRLTCSRIITLYPAFHDIINAARSLITPSPEAEEPSRA